MRRTEDLQRGILEIIAEIGGTVGVTAHHLRRGESVNVREDHVFPSASVIKVSILVELMAQAEGGTLCLQDRLKLQDADKVPGSGVLTMLQSGGELTLLDLAHLMITVSDNTASNMLIDRLGCPAINARMTALGLSATRLERKFFDFEARSRGLDNWTTAEDMATLLAAIERREIVTPAACETMLAILRKQQFDTRIPRLLPHDTPVANKTGSIRGVCHDVGIIYSPAGPLVLSVLTQDIGEAAVAEGGIRHIARLVYEYWGTA